MKEISSFTIDRLRLLGIYVSKEKSLGKETITHLTGQTGPNHESPMLTGEIHTIEASGSCLSRNHKE